MLKLPQGQWPIWLASGCLAIMVALNVFEYLYLPSALSNGLFVSACAAIVLGTMLWKRPAKS